MKALTFTMAACTALIALAGCTTTSDQSASADPAATLDASGSRYGDGVAKAGNPDNCVQTSQIRNTTVVSNRVIDFEMLNGRVYRNVLPMNCPLLKSEERFAYRTSASQLCAIDTITVLRAPGLSRGATCGLGQFQPVERAPG